MHPRTAFTTPYTQPCHLSHTQNTRCQLLALSLTLDINKQPSHVYQLYCQLSVFVAARKGDVLALRHLFESTSIPRFVRTRLEISLLESAIASTCKEPEISWYDNIVFEGRKPRELAQPVIRPESYPTDQQRRLRSLFDTIESPISLGLRLPVDSKEFQHLWRYVIFTEVFIVDILNFHVRIDLTLTDIRYRALLSVGWQGLYRLLDEL